MPKNQESKSYSLEQAQKEAGLIKEKVEKGEVGDCEEAGEVVEEEKKEERLIVNNAVRKILENAYNVGILKDIDLHLHKEIALKLIEAEDYSSVTNDLEKFSGLGPLDHKEIALKLIEAGQSFFIMGDNLKKILSLDHLHKTIALKLIEAGERESRYVAENLENFLGLDHLDHKEIALKLIEVGRIYNLAQNLEKFLGLDKEIFLKLLETKTKQGFQNIVPDYVVKNLEKFSGLDEEVVIRLIKSVGNEVVVKNLEKFSNLDYKKLALKSIEAGEGSFVANNLEMFPNLLQSQKETANDQDKPFPERQKAFNILAGLAENGETSITEDFSNIIRQRSKQKMAPESKWGLDSIQESAFYTLIRLDNPNSNEALFSLLDNENVSTTVKYEVLKKLTREDRGFLDKKTKQTLKDWLYTKSPKELDWQDLKFIKAILNNIHSTELRNKSKKQIHGAMEHFVQNKESINQEWQEKYNNIPENIFLQLWQLAQGDEGLLNKFQILYTTIRKESTTKDNLLYGIVQSLETDPEVLNLLVNKLKEVDFGSKQDAETLSDLFRKVVFLNNIDKIGSRYEHQDDDNYYDDEDEYYEKGEQESEIKIDADIEKIFTKETKSLEELTNLLQEVATKKFQEILPHKDITAEKIEKIQEKWGDLEPIFTYVGRYPDLKKYIAEMAVNFDSDENWKNWRYDLNNTTVEKQIGYLSEEQLQIWQGEYFAELGDIVVAEGGLDKSQKIKNLLREAITTDKHIFNPEMGQKKNEFIQKTLEGFYAKIEADSGKKDEIMKEEIDNITKDTDQIDAVINLNNTAKIEQILGKFFPEGQDITPSAKIKNNIGFLNNFLPKELKQSLVENYRQAESDNEIISVEKIIAPEMRQALNKAIQEIQEKSKNLDKFDIWDKHDLDKNNLKNLGQFYQKRQELQATIDLLKLNNLSNRLIVTNKIEDKQGKKGGQTLLSTLESLQKYFKDSPLLQDLKNIEFSLKEKQETMGKKRLAMIFTDNPQMLWQAGKYPLGCGSCMHYAEGSYASNLMGYVSDANCKVAYLVDLNKLSQEWQDKLDEQGFDAVKDNIPAQKLLSTSLGRTIVKMTQEKPIVLLEPTYTVEYKGDTSMDKYFNMFIDLMVTEPMNAKMARGGGKESVKVGRSRNPQGQYEDLNLSSIKFISKTSKPTKEDQEIAERIRSSGYESIKNAA